MGLMAFLHAESLPALLLKRVELSPQKTALMRKKSGVWVPTAWSEVQRRTCDIAIALQKWSLKRGESVALISQTRPAFFYCDLAIQSLGGVTVPIFSAVTADDVHFILNDCSARFVFVEDLIQYKKVERVRAQLKQKIEIVCLEKSSNDELLGLDKFLEKYLPKEATQVQSLIHDWKNIVASLLASELASIVYTSGTQGLPKGVELTHSNFLNMLEGIVRILDLSDQDVSLFFLPVAHIMGRVEQMVSIAVGMTTAYAENLNSLIDNMGEIKPTLLVSVPRVYEKIFSSVQNRFLNENIIMKEAFQLALQTGLEYSRALQKGQSPSLALHLRYMAADKLFFSAIRERLGGRLRFAVSGGAALSKELAEFFHAFGILILEGYGLTESTGPACLNRPEDFRFGSVGKPLATCQLRLSPTDSEIILSGPLLARSYHGKSGDDDGKYQGEDFYTGDIGKIDEDGFVYIVDRKRDIIVTSGGKNIAPQKIEGQFKSDPLFSNVIVLGEAKPFITALVTLHKSEARRLAEELGISTQEDSGSGEGIAKWIENSEFYALVEQHVQKINSQLASHEQIRKFRILSRELSIEAGELTPSLKVRRKFCAQKYSGLIERMYNV